LTRRPPLIKLTDSLSPPFQIRQGLLSGPPKSAGALSFRFPPPVIFFASGVWAALFHTPLSGEVSSHSLAGSSASHLAWSSGFGPCHFLNPQFFTGPPHFFAGWQSVCINFTPKTLLKRYPSPYNLEVSVRICLSPVFLFFP